MPYVCANRLEATHPKGLTTTSITTSLADVGSDAAQDLSIEVGLRTQFAGRS